MLQFRYKWSKNLGIDIKGPKIGISNIDIYIKKDQKKWKKIGGGININGPKIWLPNVYIDINAPKIGGADLDIKGPKIDAPSLEINGIKIGLLNVDVYINAPKIGGE